MDDVLGPVWAFRVEEEGTVLLAQQLFGGEWLLLRPTQLPPHTVVPLMSRWKIQRLPETTAVARQLWNLHGNQMTTLAQQPVPMLAN